MKVMKQKRGRFERMEGDVTAGQVLDRIRKGRDKRGIYAGSGEKKQHIKTRILSRKKRQRCKIVALNYHYL